MVIDSLIFLLLVCTITLLFTVSVFHKLSAPGHFLAVVADYQLVPQGLSRPLGIGLIVSELAVVIVALIGKPTISLMLGAALLGAYCVAIGINLLRGRRDIDCGCTGPAAAQTLSGWLVVRNFLLMLVALAGLLPATERILSVADWVTLGVGMCALSGLYAATNTLIANHLRLTSDRESRLWKTR